MGKADAELRPATDAGLSKIGASSTACFWQVILPGEARHIPQVVDGASGDRAHGDHGLIPGNDLIPEFIGGKALQRVQVEDEAVNDAPGIAEAQGFQGAWQMSRETPQPQSPAQGLRL